MEIEFKRINLLIGPQGAGKSLVVKLAAMFKNFLYDFRELVLGGKTDIEQKEHLVKLFNIFFPYSSWSSGSFRIEYTYSAYRISAFVLEEKPLSIEFSRELTHLIEETNQIYKGDKVGSLKQPGELTMGALGFFIHWMNAFDWMPFFTPEYVSSDRVYYREEFQNEPQKTNDWFSQQSSESFELNRYITGISRVNYLPVQEQFNQLFEDVVGCKVRFGAPGGNEDYFEYKDGRKVPLEFGSSGQKAALPLILVLLQSIVNPRTPGYKTLIIEEPEIHLFPTAQKRIVEMMALVFNSRGGNCQLLITTHSPYVLTAFNNLLEAGSVVKSHPERAEQVYQIVPKEEVLDISHVSAYTLEMGKAFDMVDYKNGLIDASLIDAVSEEISMEFDQILDLKYD